MSQRPVIVSPAEELSKKCFHCGLRNFASSSRCARCRYDVWVPLPGSKDNALVSHISRDVGRLKKAGFLIFTAILLVGLALLYVRRDSQETPGAVSKAAVAQPVMQPAEQPEQVIAAESGQQSQEAAKHVLEGLERFQRATESSMTYAEYDETLSRLKADLNNTLPSFVDHKPGDEFFRREVEAAVRDYTAAGSWWKTAERNSTVLTDADRSERLVANWTSARKHLSNAGSMLVR